MAFGAGTNADFWLENAGGTLTDISAYLDQAGLQRSAESYDVTTFGKSSHVYIGGLKDGTVPLAGPWDPTIDALLNGVLGLDGNSFEFYPQGNSGGLVKYSGACLVTKYDIDTQVDGEVTFSGEIQLSDTVTRATV